jgi:hypothetical protein
MAKFRWAVAEMDLSLGSLADRLRKRQFVLDPDAHSQGFRIQERRNGRLIGQFIERETWIETIDFPSGDQIDEVRSRVQVTQFQLKEGDRLNLVMIEPPRRLTPFFDALAEAAGFKVSVDPIKADVLKWVQDLEGHVGEVTVTYADCSGIRLTDAIVGRFAFRGTRDVRDEVFRAVGHERPVLEAVKCEFRVNGSRVAAELFRNGIAKLNDEAPEIFSAVDRSLRTAALEEAAD